MAFCEKTLQELDYYRIRDRIASFCISQEGMELLKTRNPSNNLLEIDLLKKQAKECSLFLSSTLTSGISGWEPISPILEILKVSGSTLALEALNTLGNFVTIATKTSTQIQNAAKNNSLPNIDYLCQNIPEMTLISNIIYKVIDKSGQLRDLPQLREIKNSITKIRRELETTIHSYITNPQYKDALQSDLPVLRTDRQVLAVKANSRGKIKGIIHEVSQTGQTLYIEPEDVVRKNNDLVQEEFRLQAEIKKILKDTTEQLAPFYNDIEVARSNMVHLDTCFAVAKWGIETKGVYATTCIETQNPMLLQARHPLLEDKAVPIDVVFPENCRIIIITGPNTGGKTVTLKTLALFTMLNQSGFPIPASEGTRLPICSDIFADIGDSQSLDQSLSTFSGHMKNIAKAIIKCDKDSLVLLDELGSGTDPQEGSSIAMAVLDKLIENGSWVIVTTHHSLLKNYGFSNPSCVNASAEFDENSLCPTYRIRTGVPGESHAMDIALRSGLPLEIIEKARNYLEGDHADVSSMIRGLTLKHEAIDKQKKELDKQTIDLQLKKNKLAQKEIDLRQKELDLTKQDNRESKRFLQESRKRLENLVRELREGEINQQKTRAVKQFISDLNKAILLEEINIEATQEEIEQEKEKIQQIISSDPKNYNKETKKKRLKNKDALAAIITDKKNIKTAKIPFHAGAEIKVKASNKDGHLIRQNGNQSWLVQIGSMKITLKEKDMIVTKEICSVNKNATVPIISNQQNSTLQTEMPKMELRLIGMRYEEALKTLEKQLDSASIHGLKNFSVIHGKGNGVLQTAVWDYLSKCSIIKEFHFAPPEDGGTGKTYVQLKDS